MPRTMNENRSTTKALHQEVQNYLGRYETLKLSEAKKRPQSNDQELECLVYQHGKSQILNNKSKFQKNTYSIPLKQS